MTSQYLKDGHTIDPATCHEFVRELEFLNSLPPLKEADKKEIEKLFAEFRKTGDLTEEQIDRFNRAMGIDGVKEGKEGQ